MFTAGARYSHYSLKTTNLGGISGQTLFDGPTSAVTKTSKNSAVTPKFSLSYKPNKDVLLYVLASKGFRTGNTNLVSPIDTFPGAALPQSFKPDTLWNYEIGTRVADRQSVVYGKSVSVRVELGVSRIIKNKNKKKQKKK